MKTQFLRALSVAALATMAFGQTVESIPFRANMSPANEVPAIAGLNASGFATVWVHVVRDASGKVVSGSLDYSVRYQFPGATTFTGLHIHRGAAGVNGPVLLDSRITAANPVVDETGKGQIDRPVLVPAGTANVAVIEELLGNPSNFYINLHTTVNPGGAIRSQLLPAERRVYGAVLSPENEVPATNSQARGIGFLTMLNAFDGGKLVSSEVTFDIDYAGFADGTQFTGMHIHSGRAGANGPVTIDTTLSRAQNVFAGAGGSGKLKYVIDANLAAAATLQTIYDVWNDPSSGYWNLHTVANPGGEIRSQLRSTETFTRNMLMSPANEVPAITGLEASANARFDMSLLRRPDGSALAAYTVFDVNHNFPGETTFTGLHIHTGNAGANGPVTIDSGIRAGATVASATGFGNIYRAAIMSSTAQVDALNNVMTNTDNNYINLHTTVNPGGAVRSQMAAPNTNVPAVQNVILSVSDPTLKTMGRGGLMTIYGTNLAKNGGNLDGWQGNRAPSSLNGTSVDVSGTAAPVLQVAPGFVVAQVPTEAPAAAVLTVKSVNGTSAPYNLTVAAAAPGIFFDQISSDGSRAVVYNLTTVDLVTKESPVVAGTPLAIFSTGMGAANPPLGTGQVTPPALHRFDSKLFVGGREVTNSISYSIPGLIGLAQTVFAAPAGLSGPQTLELEVGGVRSNKTVLYLR